MKSMRLVHLIGWLLLGFFCTDWANGVEEAGGGVSLIAADKPNGGWAFNNGPEFPGATGGVELVADAGEGKPALKISGDFNKGGNYVQASCEVKVDAAVLIFRLKAKGATQITMRLGDGSKQCHQIDLKLDPRADWQTIEFPIHEFFKKMGTSAALPNVGRYEKWGGPNDGKWHAPMMSIAFLATRNMVPNELQPAVWIGGIKVVPAGLPAFAEDFEKAELPQGWACKGAVKLEEGGAFKGKRALKLERGVEQLQQETEALGPDFPAAAGTWQIEGAFKTALHSADNSYNVALTVQALKSGGSVLETIPIEERFGEKTWQGFKRRMNLPRGTVKARFAVRMNKADGACWIDELTATRLPDADQAENRIERIEIYSDRLGNLLLPADKPIFHVKVEAVRALKETEQSLMYTVCDYWGAEQAAPGSVALKAEEKEKDKDKGRFVYTADLDLSGVPLTENRFFELHVEVPREKGEGDTEITGFAMLPEAPNKQVKPEQSPFTIRNWDDRIKEYFFLSDRLGLRSICIWGGWQAKPPYKPEAPGIEWCKDLGMRWITGTRAAAVEHEGFKNFDETALREGAKNFMQTFNADGYHLVSMGNEPHGKREKVKENVRAYQAVYEEIKKVNPKIFVIGTSVEPNDDYFQEGYYKYLDAYDYHVYGSYKGVRNTFREYKALMKKYDAVKPVYSTEIGLNSQGMPRYAVAVELLKSTTAFFAEGGASVSWFTIQYPDPKGKARGTSGDAHCVFDCKYSRYNPRLDAIAYYDIVNAVGDKAFAEEKQYPGGTQAYLFKNAENRCLQVLWNDEARKDVAVPFPGVASVELVRLDGGRTVCALEKDALTIRVGNEPVLLLYAQEKPKLAEALGAAAFTVSMSQDYFVKGRANAITVKGDGLKASALRVLPPPLWKAELKDGEAGAVECKLTPPENTSARAGSILIQRSADKDAVRGEINLILQMVEGSTEHNIILLDVE
ncbi:MAG: hypothetical protein HY291_11935 [Planctomycetes bacterium]|nr:hypothetical protein [Planctomycetota bacterium]